jgi:lipoyl(octanoyl) transferase
MDEREVGAGLDGASKVHDAEWAWLGRVPYAQALRLQERIREQVVHGSAPDTLLLLEHPPVITLGRHAHLANVLASPERLARDGIALVRTSRGGDVTLHGPGQLVGYPVFRLRRGLRAHLGAIAEAVIRVLADLGIVAAWDPSRPGIWVGHAKICAVGVHVVRHVAIHGFALNASIDLAAFGAIVPCGLRSAGVTSIARVLGAAPALESLADSMATACARAFALRLRRIPANSSRLQIASVDR